MPEAGIEPSVGSVGDYDVNTLAETISGLCKANVVHKSAPWRPFEAAEYATREQIDRSDNRRLMEPTDNILPAEAEARYYAMLNERPLAAQLKPNGLQQTWRDSPNAVDPDRDT